MNSNPWSHNQYDETPVQRAHRERRQLRVKLNRLERELKAARLRYHVVCQVIKRGDVTRI